MMKISRRDFFKTFAAMAAVGTMNVMPSIELDEIEIEEEDKSVDKYKYGNHECHLCDREPRLCIKMMYTCHRFYALETGKPVDIEVWDWDTGESHIVGVVYP